MKKYAPYHLELQRIRHVQASGIYAIVRGREVLYVGESHSGRLYDTITRHFRAWKVDPSTDALGRRRGGTMYNRYEVRVVYVVTEPGTAQALQYAEIERLRPRDNSIDGKAVDVIPVIPVSVREIEENPPRDENERRGREAMRRVLKKRRDEWDAMSVRGSSDPVSFVWGDSKGGIRHVLDKHGALTAMSIPRVLARAEKIKHERTNRGRIRVIVEHGNRRVVLSQTMHERVRTWVVTGYLLKK